MSAGSSEHSGKMLDGGTSVLVKGEYQAHQVTAFCSDLSPFPASFTFTHKNHALLRKTPVTYNNSYASLTHLRAAGLVLSCMSCSRAQTGPEYIFLMEIAEAGEASQPLRLFQASTCVSAVNNNGLAKASHMAKVKGKRQGSIPSHREGHGKSLDSMLSEESQTGAVLIPK